MVHRSSLAGTWYPAEADRLREDVERYLAPEPPQGATRVRALLLPHAGYRWSGPVAGQAVSIWKGRRVGRVVVMGPSHRARLHNAIAMPSSDEIETPLGRLAVDRGFLDALSVEPVFRWIPEAHVGEHSVEVELPLLQQALGTFSLVPLVVGDLDPDAARRAAAAIATRLGPDDVVVASSDLTHYGPRFDYVPFDDDVPRRLRELDLGAVEAIERCDPGAFTEYVRRTGATICGRRPIEVLLHMLPADATARLVAYDTSGAIGGTGTAPSRTRRWRSRSRRGGHARATRPMRRDRDSTATTVARSSPSPGTRSRTGWRTAGSPTRETSATSPRPGPPRLRGRS